MSSPSQVWLQTKTCGSSIFTKSVKIFQSIPLLVYTGRFGLYKWQIGKCFFKTGGTGFPIFTRFDPTVNLSLPPIAFFYCRCIVLWYGQVILCSLVNKLFTETNITHNVGLVLYGTSLHTFSVTRNHPTMVTQILIVVTFVSDDKSYRMFLSSNLMVKFISGRVTLLLASSFYTLRSPVPMMTNITNVDKRLTVRIVSSPTGFVSSHVSLLIFSEKLFIRLKLCKLM